MHIEQIYHEAEQLSLDGLNPVSGVSNAPQPALLLFSTRFCFLFTKLR